MTEWKVNTKDYPRDTMDDVILEGQGTFELPNRSTFTLRGKITFGALFEAMYQFYVEHPECLEKLGDNVHFEGIMKSYLAEDKWFVWLS